MSIAIVVLTHDRLPLLRQCVANVLGVTSPETTEILIWDNGSFDGTPEYLATLDDPRITIVTAPSNVGMVAYGRAIAMTHAPFIVQVDDDVLDAPPRWDEQLVAAFRALPRMAWLAADLEDNPTDRASYDRHYRDHYTERTTNGVRLLDGPTGGWCTITSRTIYDSVGGLPTSSRQVYFSTDSIYVKKIEAAGYEYAILSSLRVRHSGDSPEDPPPSNKARFHEREAAIQRRKDRVKRALLRLPGVRAANQRRNWFHDPDEPPVRRGARAVVEQGEPWRTRVEDEGARGAEPQ
jgi:GT2 family glycosyltransferase